MIGVVIVTHVNLAEQFIEAGKMILGEMKQVESVGIFNRESVDEMRSKIIDAIKKVDTGDGVIILVDMFGGTPSNMALAFLEEGKVEVVTGVNLPMLLKVLGSRNMPLNRLASEAKCAGCQGIVVAGELLRSKIDGK